MIAYPVQFLVAAIILALGVHFLHKVWIGEESQSLISPSELMRVIGGAFLVVVGMSGIITSI